MSSALDLLWPRPRVARLGSGVLDAGAGLAIGREGGPGALAEARLRRGMERLGLPAVERGRGGIPGVRLAVERAAGASAEAYRLEVEAAGATIAAAAPEGFLRGAGTLLRWLRLHPAGRVPALRVEDAPDLAVRGVMLDVSRDKVPRLDTILLLVDRLAELEINQLQLYFEHTFAYAGHETAWAGADPLGPDDVRRLDRACAERGIELVPNQNSFGHFHRWLKHDRYRDLAEVPEGFEHPFSDEPEPFSLCPTDPRSLELLAGLYDQLLPCFASRQVNVGLDETMDLGMGRSRAEVERRGKIPVYLDFLRAVHRLVGERGHRMQFWGDIIVGHPEAIPELPRDAVALEWGYEAGHPFAEHGARFAASGLEFLVCPGTSSWSSLVGRWSNARTNLAEACRLGHAAGAAGVLITDWGDFGHLQPLPVSYPGFLAGAGFAWNVASAEDPDAVPFAALLDTWIFDDAAGELGAALLRLGDVYRHSGTRNRNGSALFYLLAFAGQGLDHVRYEGLAETGLARAADETRDALGAVTRARPAAPGEESAMAELLWAGRLIEVACDLGRARLAAGGGGLDELPSGVRRDLAARLRPLVQDHPAIWALRNRPGGREDSVQRLARTLGRLRPSP